MSCFFSTNVNPRNSLGSRAPFGGVFARVSASGAAQEADRLPAVIQTAAGNPTAHAAAMAGRTTLINLAIPQIERKALIQSNQIIANSKEDASIVCSNVIPGARLVGTRIFPPMFKGPASSDKFESLHTGCYIWQNCLWNDWSLQKMSSARHSSSSSSAAPIYKQKDKVRCTWRDGTIS